MSTYELPLVGPIVDEVVSKVESNRVLDSLPEFIRSPLTQAIELALDAAAYFAVALTLGGGLFYLWPSFAALAPRHLSPLNGYWSYVLVVLACFVVRIAYVSVVGDKKADVLREAKRADALKALSVPGMLIMLAWLITVYIS